MTVTTVQKWGNSQGVRIPRHILDEAGLEPNVRVEIATADGCIVIRRAADAHKKSIRELFDGYTGDYTASEVDWGEGKGREVW